MLDPAQAGMLVPHVGMSFFSAFFLCHEANALHGSDWKLTQKGLAHVTPIVAGMSKVRMSVRAEKLPM